MSLRTVVLDVPPQDVITQGQRVGEGERGPLLPRHGSAAGDRGGRELPLRDVAARPDDAAERAGTGGAGRPAVAAGAPEPASFSRSSISAPIPWGIKVSAVEVKHVDLPENMQRAMARQAEAEREKRAKIIHAAGELEASEKLSQAAAVIATEPMAITLRYLQTLTEIAAEKNSTIIFPLPIELLNLLKPMGSAVDPSETRPTP